MKKIWLILLWLFGIITLSGCTDKRTILDTTLVCATIYQWFVIDDMKWWDLYSKNDYDWRTELCWDNEYLIWDAYNIFDKNQD